MENGNSENSGNAGNAGKYQLTETVINLIKETDEQKNRQNGKDKNKTNGRRNSDDEYDPSVDGLFEMCAFGF